jgi:hypothetical protein
MEVPPSVPHPQKFMLAGFLNFGDVNTQKWTFIGAAAMVVLSFVLLGVTKWRKETAHELLVITVFFDLLAFPLLKKLTSVFSCAPLPCWCLPTG